MRKVLSVVLAVAVVLASMLTVSALESAISVNVEANSDDAYIQEITVTVPASVSGTMTLQITKKSEIPTKLYAMNDTNTYADEDGKRKYYAEVTMPSDAVTGIYYLWIGNNVEKKPYEFNYTSLVDKINFYNDLIEAIKIDEAEAEAGKIAADEVGQYLNNPDTKCTADPADLEAYNGLSDSIKGKVNATLVLMQNDEEIEKDLVFISDTETDGRVKSAKTRKNDEIFLEAFHDAISLALIADVSESDWEEMANDAMTDTIFDNEYYIVQRTGNPDADELNDEILLDVADAYNYFKSEGAAITTLDLIEYQKAFDKATLLVVVDTLDYSLAKDAFLYYENKGSITVTDMKNIDDLVAAGKDTDLWKNLKISGYTDAATLAANAEFIAKSMVEGGALEQTAPGGNVPSNSPTIDKPSTPGASMGIVSGTTITPAEPVNPTQPEPVKGFADLAQAEWSREAVEYLEKAGVISGKSANSFAPNDAVTREEGAKIIVAAFGLLGDAECDFADVSKDRWSYAYIAAAVKHGIINGYGESFGATDTMTREQAATIIYRAAEKIALEVSGEKSEFADDEHASDWSRDAIAHLAADGVIKGMGDGTFAPKATLTRAQLAQLVYNVLVTIGGVK